MKKHGFAAKIVDQKPAPPRTMTSVEDAEFDERLRREKAALDQADATLKERDKIGILLGASFYYTGMTWAFLRNEMKVQYSVSRFYPQLKLAVDIFVKIEAQERREIGFKRAAFKRNGFRYGALDYSMQLTDLVPQVGL